MPRSSHLSVPFSRQKSPFRPRGIAGRGAGGKSRPMKLHPTVSSPSRLRGLYLLGLAFVLHANAAPREDFLAAKHTATEANFHNDKIGLHAAITAFDAHAADAALGPRALYHAAWTEWMLAASQLQDDDSADAIASLESGAARLRRVLEKTPDDGEAHSLLAWMLMSIGGADTARFPQLFPAIREHRQRALALAPHSPRVVMFDGTLLFYSPQPGTQEKGLARWQEALQLLAAEKIADPTQPDWGRTLAEGWLANLLLQTKPPHAAEARVLAEKALKDRPDFWWVATLVLPKTVTP